MTKQDQTQSQAAPTLSDYLPPSYADTFITDVSLVILRLLHSRPALQHYVPSLIATRTFRNPREFLFRADCHASPHIWAFFSQSFTHSDLLSAIKSLRAALLIDRALPHYIQDDSRLTNFTMSPSPNVPTGFLNISTLPLHMPAVSRQWTELLSTGGTVLHKISYPYGLYSSSLVEP